MVVWRKSSYSAQTECVEVGRGVGIRDSKTSGQLSVGASAWSAFLVAVKSDGQFVGAWSPRCSTRPRT